MKNLADISYHKSLSQDYSYDKDRSEIIYGENLFKRDIFWK